MDNLTGATPDEITESLLDEIDDQDFGLREQLAAVTYDRDWLKRELENLQQTNARNLQEGAEESIKKDAARYELSVERQKLKAARLVIDRLVVAARAINSRIAKAHTTVAYLREWIKRESVGR